MDHRFIAASAIMYGGGTVLTLGHLYRRHGAGLRPKHLMFSLVWPLYWLVALGIGQSIDLIAQTFYGTSAREMTSFAIGVFTMGFFIFNHSGHCSGGSQCAAIWIMALSMIATPANLIYLTWLGLGSAIALAS